MTIFLSIEPQMLTKRTIALLAASIAEQVITQTDGDLAAVAMYDVFKALETAAKDAMPTQVKAQALAEAEDLHMSSGCTAAEVIINGIPHQVKHKPVYDFTHKRAWIAKQRLVVKAEAALKAAKVQLAGVEDSLRLCNQPDHIETTLAFTPLDA